MKEKIETKKYTDFTKEHIKKYLDKLKRLVLEGNYLIPTNKNRSENLNFNETYKINTKKEKEILMSIQFDDFCYAVDNENAAYPNERLYVFCKEYELDNWGDVESVEIYAKCNLLQTVRGDDFLVVVSFHKLNKPIKRLFR